MWRKIVHTTNATNWQQIIVKNETTKRENLVGGVFSLRPIHIANRIDKTSNNNTWFGHEFAFCLFSIIFLVCFLFPIFDFISPSRSLPLSVRAFSSNGKYGKLFGAEIVCLFLPFFCFFALGASINSKKNEVTGPCFYFSSRETTTESLNTKFKFFVRIGKRIRDRVKRSIFVQRQMLIIWKSDKNPEYFWEPSATTNSLRERRCKLTTKEEEQKTYILGRRTENGEAKLKIRDNEIDHHHTMTSATYFEIFVICMILLLPFLYETSHSFRYYFKYAVYYSVVSINSIILIPPMLCRPCDVKNLL